MHTTGISPLISWVLLIGFTVTLGVIVSQWLKDQAEHTTDVLVDENTRKLHCTDTSLNVYLSPTCDTLNVTNTGVFTIRQVHVRSKFGTEPVPALIPPQQTQTLNMQTVLSSGESADIIPAIMIENALVPCSTRTTSVTC